MKNLELILESAKNKIKVITSSQDLYKAKVEYLGKGSQIVKEMKKISLVAHKKRKRFGQKINQVRTEIKSMLDKQSIFIEKSKLLERFKNEKIDLTIPARSKAIGSIHPITQCLDELTAVFFKYGFDIKDGPNIEEEWYNFTALNIDRNHPARQMHDTFYLNKTNDKTRILRTHTSPIQIRTMLSEDPPYRFIAPGIVYRADSDLTHTPMFHQIEGMVIDRKIHIGHLKYLVSNFIQTFFEKSNIKVQFRSSFFPFTEPSAEVDIKVNEHDKWLEVLGCGMVHPNVLRNVNIDPQEYQGFAFGLGVERLAMLKYGIEDLRKFFEGDIRWLKHYSFSTLDIPTLVGGLTR